MHETRRCPGCGSAVSVPERMEDMSVGCLNVDDHDDGGSLVMWPEGRDD